MVKPCIAPGLGSTSSASPSWITRPNGLERGGTARLTHSPMRPAILVSVHDGCSRHSRERARLVSRRRLSSAIWATCAGTLLRLVRGVADLPIGCCWPARLGGVSCLVLHALTHSLSGPCLGLRMLTDTLLQTRAESAWADYALGRRRWRINLQTSDVLPDPGPRRHGKKQEAFY